MFTPRKITYAGRTQSLGAWARESPVNSRAFLWRLRAGWSVERALTTPYKGSKNIAVYRGGIDGINYQQRHEDYLKMNSMPPPPPRPTPYDIPVEIAGAILDRLGRPPITTTQAILDNATPDERQALSWDRNRREPARVLIACGYSPVLNPGDRTKGRWLVRGHRIKLYGRSDLSPGDREAAARAEQRRQPEPWE